jgi:hypothetical protein
MANRESTEMHQVNARHEIIREWRSLPKELRQTDEQAAAFAMQIKDNSKFSRTALTPIKPSRVGCCVTYRLRAE